MAKLQTAVLVLMFCLLLEKSSWVSGSSEVERNRGSNNVQVGGVRHFRGRQLYLISIIIQTNS
jgi:hypothetical protein